MSNSYYQFSGAVTPGSTIRSDKYNSDQQGVESGFDLVEDVTNRAILLDVAHENNELPEAMVDSMITVGPSGVGLFPSSALLIAAEKIDNAEGFAESARLSADKAQSILSEIAKRGLPLFSSGPTIELYSLHSLGGGEYLAPNITAADAFGGEWFLIRASSDEPVLKRANEDIGTAKFKRLADGAIDTFVTFVNDDKDERAFVYNKIENVWEF